MASLFDEGDAEETGNLRVNEEFATRFEHNKSREGLHRLREKHPALAARLEAQAVSGTAAVEVSEDEDDTSSDEDDEPAEQMNGEFLEALLKIRNRDATIYQTDAVLFPEKDETNSEELSRVKKQKPVYLRQVIAEQAMAEAGNAASKVEEEPVTYLKEQDELKRDFLRAAEDTDREVAEGSFGGVMQVRQHGGSGVPAVDEKLLEEVFGKAGNDAGDSFLKDYIARQAWDEDAEENHVPLHQQVAEQLAADEDYSQRADHFEATYNFRYQEDDAAQIVTYPREVEGLVRKTDDRRKLARKRKAERKETAVAERAAEVRRLKNLKRGEVDERLAEIQRISGHQGRDALSKLVEGDFDPAAYDAAMAAAFDADYYQGEDDGDVMDEDLARELAEMDSYGEETDALSLAHEKASAAAATAAVADDNVTAGTSGKVDSKQLQEEKARVQQLMDEYFKLDYESTVGGLPCRFRYREVPAASYGLDVLDILGIDQKDLNQVVSMKKLAPYREDGGLARPNYAKVRELKNKMQEEQAAALRPKAGGKRKQTSDATPSIVAKVDEVAALPARVKKEKKQRTSVPAPAKEQLKSPTLPPPPALPDAASIAAAAARSERNKAWQKEKRLETFAPLTLRRADKELSLGAEKRLKNKNAEIEKAASKAAGAADGVQLTKAQKKNLKRGIKRKAA